MNPGVILLVIITASFAVSNYVLYKMLVVMAKMFYAEHNILREIVKGVNQPAITASVDISRYTIYKQIGFKQVHTVLVSTGLKKELGYLCGESKEDNGASI